MGQDEEQNEDHEKGHIGQGRDPHQRDQQRVRGGIAVGHQLLEVVSDVAQHRPNEIVLHSLELDERLAEEDAEQPVLYLWRHGQGIERTSGTSSSIGGNPGDGSCRIVDDGSHGLDEKRQLHDLPVEFLLETLVFGQTQEVSVAVNPWLRDVLLPYVLVKVVAGVRFHRVLVECFEVRKNIERVYHILRK